MSAGGSMLDEAPSEQVTPMERLYDLEERFFVLCERVLNHDAFSNLMGILTVFALFGDDLRLAFCPPDSDESFTIISCIALLKVMSKAKFVAPANWKGFRALTSKT